MEQITVTLNRETLEQLPPSVLVGLLMAQVPTAETETEPTQAPQVAQLAKDTNATLLSLFPAEPAPEKVKPAKGKYTNRKWTRKDDLALIYGHSKGHMTFEQLAEQLGRNYQGIKMRIYRLEREGRL
jgi:hypothetical protein